MLMSCSPDGKVTIQHAILTMFIRDDVPVQNAQEINKHPPVVGGGGGCSHFDAILESNAPILTSSDL